METIPQYKLESETFFILSSPPNLEWVPPSTIDIQRDAKIINNDEETENDDHEVVYYC